jgi:NAD(P)-dependent dehydrogenase (short-subunit alcohol dehydrogenase family)
MTTHLRKIVVFGATSSIAEHCVRRWCREQPADITLVGRHVGRLERVAADLRVRSPASSVCVLSMNLMDPVAIRQAVDGLAGGPETDIVLIAQGALPEQAQCQDDLRACRDALEVNALSPVLCAEAFAGHMQKAGHGTIVILGSVAGDRGRRSNYVYGAAKGLLERHAQGMRHRFAGTGVKVVLVKPGPTDTPMTAGMKSQGLTLAPVEREIVDAAARGRAVLYTPKKWAPIMFVIRHLPAFVFNRMNI